ncbi:MAG: alpha/beta hydrolase [Pseudomonadota bacterium]
MNTTSTRSAQTDLDLLDVDLPDWFVRALQIPRREDFVDVAGTRIHYFQWGDPTLPGVVMTHGFMAHARCWAFIAPFLAARYSVVAFDLSGMGDSGWRTRYDTEVRAEECMAVAIHAGLTAQGRRPALVCHSYGGGIGLAAVERQPDFWSQMIVCDMTMLAPGETSQFEEQRRQQQNRGVRPHKVAADLAQVFARFRLAPEQPCANTFLLHYMAVHSVKAVDGGYVWKFDPAIFGPDPGRDPEWWQSIAPRFTQLSIPAAVIYGEHSAMLSERVLAYLSDAQVPLVKITDAHHHIMLDQPLALIAAIESLLQTLS